MTTTALPEPVSGSHVRTLLARAARYARTERGIVTLALGAIGLHVADDNYLQPEPGTSPLEHLASGLSRSASSPPSPSSTRASAPACEAGSH